MTIQLKDLDIPYEVATDVTAESKGIIRISPQSDYIKRNKDYDICLDKEGVEKLIRTLQFVLQELRYM